MNGDAVRGQRDALIVEIERLRGELRKQPAESLVVLDLKEQLMSKNAEIERLRDEIQNRNAKINRLTEELRTWKDTKFEIAAGVLRAHDDETKEAEAEIERLRGEVKLMRQMDAPTLAAIEKRDAEIERLRKSLDDHLDSEAAETRRRLISWAQNEEMVNVGFTEHGIDCIAAAEVMEKQSAEIERLRHMLDELRGDSAAPGTAAPATAATGECE